MSGRHYFIVAALLLASACSKSSSSTPRTVATATPTPAAFSQHLYVANDVSSGGIAQYTLPLTTGATPNFTVAVNQPTAVAFDAQGDLAVGAGGQILFYHTPFVATSTPTATFSGGGGNLPQLAFFTGTLYATTLTPTVNSYTPPFSSGTMPSTSIVTANVQTFGIGFDAAGNLYISAYAPTPNASSLYVYAPPYTGTPIITPAVSTLYEGLTVLGSTLFVANNPFTGTGSVDAYTLPLTATSTPAYSITSGIDSPRSVSLDSAQRLYVANGANETITEYTPPFASSNTPTTTLQLPGGTNLTAITVGP